jgi:phosphate transport system permease protein
LLESISCSRFWLVVVACCKRFIRTEYRINGINGAICLLSWHTVIITISEDAIKSVPSSYKEASLALGASKLTTIWKVVVPAALSGIIAAIMLGMGRVVGETMAVMMVTGNAPVVSFDPFTSVRTMTATIAAEMGEVTFGSAHYSALFWVGIVLMIMTFLLNLISFRVLKKYGLYEK